MEMNFLCCICKKIPSNVVESGCCNSLFCWECVVATCSNMNKQCPSCNRELNPEGCVENLAVKKIVDSISVRCTNDGCNETFPASLRSLHEDACPKGSSLCPNSELCGILLRQNLQEHLKVCGFRLTECHLCGTSIPVNILKEHLDTLCPEVVTECMLCDEKTTRRSIQTHVDNDCPKALVECPFAHLGCTYQPERGSIPLHMHDDVPKHLELMTNVYQDQQIQINTLRNELAEAQNAAQNYSRPGCIFGDLFDRRIRDKLNDLRARIVEPFLQVEIGPAVTLALVSAIIMIIVLIPTILRTLLIPLIWIFMRAAHEMVRASLYATKELAFTSLRMSMYYAKLLVCPAVLKMAASRAGMRISYRNWTGTAFVVCSLLLWSIIF